jgi:hypothetical protein
MAPTQCSAAKEVLSALDADPALIEHYDPDEIEAIPLASILARLVELDLTPAMPVKLQRLLFEPATSPAADVLRVLADDMDGLQPQNIEARPLDQVIACLRRDGINYRAGIAAINDFLGEQASGSAGHDQDQTKVRSMKPATLWRRKPLLWATIGSAAAATAAAATVGFFVTREARQDKVIADQRYEIQELSATIQGLNVRLNERGPGPDDLVSVTAVVPAGAPDERAQPPRNGDNSNSGVGNAPAKSVAVAPETRLAGGSGGPDNVAPDNVAPDNVAPDNVTPDNVAPAPGGVPPETPRAGETPARPDDALKSRVDKSKMAAWPSFLVAPEAPPVDSPNLKAWFQRTQSGDQEGATKSLEEAARNGDIMAAWKLGRLYADGDGVKKDDLRAFAYFRSIAEIPHVEDVAGTPQALFVANALVALGEYYLNGIPDSDVKPDPVQARQKFYNAASFFGNATAQYHLGRMYLDGLGGAKDTKNAARWLHAAAMKGQYEAQAVFGGMLFKGQSVPRDGAKGLMFLKLAMDAATPKEVWIADQYNAAWKQATEDERAVALVHVGKWKERSR